MDNCSNQLDKLEFTQAFLHNQELLFCILDNGKQYKLERTSFQNST